MRVILAVYATLPLASPQLPIDVDVDPDATVLGNFIKPIKNNGNNIKSSNENMRNVYNIYVEQHHHFHGKKIKSKEDIAHPLGMAGQVSHVSVFKLKHFLLYSIM